MTISAVFSQRVILAADEVLNGLHARAQENPWGDCIGCIHNAAGGSDVECDVYSTLQCPYVERIVHRLAVMHRAAA